MAQLLHLILPIIFDNSWLLLITPNYSRWTPDYSQLLPIALIIPDYWQLELPITPDYSQLLPITPYYS